MPETPAQGIWQLHQRFHSAVDVVTVLARALVLPVFTPRPSKVRRRTVLEKIEAIAEQLGTLESVRLLPAERDRVIDAMASEVETFWLTEIVRDERPSAADEKVLRLVRRRAHF